MEQRRLYRYCRDGHALDPDMEPCRLTLWLDTCIKGATPGPWRGPRKDVGDLMIYRVPRCAVRWAPALALVACALLSFSPAHASRVRPINLEEMAQRADRIFLGRCVGLRVEVDPDLGQEITYATFVTRRTAKGSAHGKVTIKLLGDQVEDGGPSRGVEGVPRFREGEEVVLFLYGDSRRGLTSPVGLGQGKFVVFEDKQGRPLALNSTGNETLFHNLSPGARKKLGGLSARPEHGAPGGIAPDALLDMVLRLDEKP